MAGASLKRRSDGFLERGVQVTRVEAFVDAAFAFAVTVLVLRVFDGVDSVAGLSAALKELPGLLASFGIIVMFWWAHQTWSRRYGMDDGRSVLGSVMLVFLVAVYVYPLHLVFQSAFAWLSRLLLPESAWIPFKLVLNEEDRIGDLAVMFVVYGVAWSTLSLTIVTLYRQAWRRRDELQLDVAERVATRTEIARWLWAASLGVVSIGLVLLLPTVRAWMISLSGMVYSAMALTGVVMKISARRARPKIEAECR